MGIPLYFVLDTCALINCGLVELAGVTVLDRLRRKYTLVIPDKVTEEFEDVIQLPDYDDRRTEVKSRVRRWVRRIPLSTYSPCLPVLKKWYSIRRKATVFRDRLGDGEKHCMALALFLNRYCDVPVCLLTDDFKARNKFNVETLILEQQVGWVASSFESILYAYRNAPAITFDQLQAAWLDYLQVLRGPLRPLKRTKLEEKLKLLCRKIGSENGICSMECCNHSLIQRILRRC